MGRNTPMGVLSLTDFQRDAREKKQNAHYDDTHFKETYGLKLFFLTFRVAQHTSSETTVNYKT